MEIPGLLKEAQSGKARFFLQFGGQGNSYLSEMRRLYRNNPELEDFFSCSFEAINECLKLDDIGSTEIFSHGFDLKSWLEEQELPPVTYLSNCSISLAGVQITQLAYYFLLVRRGYPIEELVKYTVGTTGHSQGVLAAVFSSLGLEGDELFEALQKGIKFLIMGGYRCQEIYPAKELSSELQEKSQALDNHLPTPMVSIFGVAQQRLQAILDDYNRNIPAERAVSISLINTTESLVISGSEADLLEIRSQTKAEFDESEYKWAYLDISAPFHCHIMPEALVKFREDLKRIEYNYCGSDLKFPVYSTHDGSNLQNMAEIGEHLFLLQSSLALNWPLSIAALKDDPTITHVIDFGPGKASRLFTQEVLKEQPEKEVISIVGRSGFNRLLET